MNELPPVPVTNFGRDHWSTLAYVETRIVDHGGVLCIEHMRCHPRVHRRFAHEGSMGSSAPTRLRDDSTLDRHDDWSCVEDLVAAGLLTMTNEKAAERGQSPTFALTATGLALAQSLRAHKATGGSFATFDPTVAVRTT